MTESASTGNNAQDPQLARLLSRIDGIIAGDASADAGAENLPPAMPSMPGVDAVTQPAPREPSLNENKSGPAGPTASAPITNGKVGPSTLPGSVVDESKALAKLTRKTGERDEPFIPLEPPTLQDAGLTESLIEEFIVRFLASAGEASGRQIATQVQLPFRMIEPILNRLKQEQLTAYRGANSVGDYTHVLSDSGRDRARQFNMRCTYFGAAPVPLDQYCNSVAAQSLDGQYPRQQELLQAFKDLLIDRNMLAKLGPAINSGRGMFLYGYPGNGKTSIAERVTQAFGKYIWIPRAILIDSEIMRLYDPLMHELADPEDEQDQQSGLLSQSVVDPRWVRIKRPTIIAGGELTMDMLESQRNDVSKVSEAPLQMKSNCGVLVIDDFGRQKMGVDELLNRWIVPLEKRYDFLNMTSGKKTQVPFEQLVIFSTNLEPKDLVDDAFLRRIPYKIEVKNPTEKAFRKLFQIMCPIMGLPYNDSAVDYLIETHYRATDRPLRNCHPRDLLLQIKNYCLYHDQPMELKKEYVDFAVDNYFSIM
jgi:hypothetical protein